jgi:8-oxo-dGTP diphosphatase
VVEPRVGVGVVVRRGGEVLLMLRARAHGLGTWSPPGGKLDFGETPVECGAREVREETGVRIREPRFVGCTNDVFDASHWVTLWFEAGGEGEAKRASPEEAAEVRWFSEEELPEPLFPPYARLLAGELV